MTATSIELPTSARATNAAQAEDQYLTFSVGRETYAVDLLHVQEIRGYAPATPIPQSPPWVRGVIHLRGTVIPILDLRMKLGLEEKPFDRFTVIIVVNVGDRTFGIIVDAVTEVRSLLASEIQPTPDLGGGSERRFARGVARVQDSLVVLIDLECLVGSEPLHVAAG